MIYIELNLTPLSVNKAWRGKRFKTKEYLQYEKNCLLLLPQHKIEKGKLEIEIEYGFSSTLSDIDNPTKLILDILQKKYGFDDKDIYKLILSKTIVKKGFEYSKLKIKQL